MKRVILFAFLGSFLVLSCRNEQKNSPNQKPTTAQNDTTSAIYDETMHLLINDPTDIWQTDYLAFRVFHRENSRGGRDFFSYNEAGYKDVKSMSGSCWNLVFYNTKTRSYYLLDSIKKMLIYDYNLNDTAHGKITRHLARYTVQFDDNKDGKFTIADAKRFFVSDRLGKSFHQVSPQGVSVLRYEFAPKENFLLIYGLKDANQDGVFDEKDHSSVYRLDLNQSAENTETAQPVFSTEFENRLQKRAEKEWKLPKD